MTRPHPRLLLTPQLIRQTPRRTSSNAVATVEPSTNDGNEPYHNAAQIRHFRARDNENFVENFNKGVSKAEERAVQKELSWLKDPLKLADHVHYTIRCDKLDKALGLCRAASKEMSCVVAWNHLVDYYMKEQKINEAIKVYNEMKKRSQFPDSYTYILLLRGFVKNQQPHLKMELKDEHIAKAVSIYHSMSSPTSRVKPTIMHTNAVLRVCSFSDDLDAFWGVASSIPAHGPQSADAITFTIILEAIRHNAVYKNPKDFTDVERAQKATQAAHEGKKVWQDVVQKWRSGEVKMDEELVCSMARVLLISDRLQDWDDVLNLVQQTMQIERLVAPIEDPNRHTEHVPQLQAPAELVPSEQVDHEGYTLTPAGKVFKEVQPLPADPARPKRPTSLAYVQPGNEMLSAIINACVLMRSPKTASAYWDLFTKSFGVIPDLANFHALLALLRTNRSSKRASVLLGEDMPKAGVTPTARTFRLAMGVCMRDKNNHTVVDHARTIIDTMEATIADVDIHTVQQYFRLALGSNDGPKIVATLNRLDSIIHNMRSMMTYGSVDEARRDLSAAKHLDMKEEIAALFSQMIGAIDTLMNRGLVPREDFIHWHGRRSQLRDFLQRTSPRMRNAQERFGDSNLGLRPLGQLDHPEASRDSDPEARKKKPDRMNKGSWELMMFRKRNAERRTLRPAAGDIAWGGRARQPRNSESKRPWAKDRSSSGQRRGNKGNDFADSPTSVGM